MHRGRIFIRPRRVLLWLSRLRGVVAGDRLDLEIFLEAVFAPFAAVAGLLVAAERRGAIVRHALQIDVAGANPAAHFARTLHRIGGNVAGKPIGRVVGDPHGIFFVLGADDGENGAEDFLARDRHIVGDVGKDRRANVEALVDTLGEAGAAGNERRTFLDALVDQRLDLVPLNARHDGADGGA